MRKVELLAPARNADIGIEAIRHGADAVYIGASEFGARASAGNDIDDIRRLVEYAHIYRAKVYVTVNTIIYESEIADVEAMIWELYRIGVDALIVQDLGLLKMNLPPIPLHASTQMDNRTADKVRFLRSCGYRQVVLARELTVQQIASIHEACPDVALEVFIHGAMCVSYSGQCYASEAVFGRSANRGECAQLCRMEYDLLSRTACNGQKEGERVLARNKRLLSIPDNCQIANLERLMDAGAVSFKIEGRLKDMDYVKNVTADYSRKLDEIIARRPGDYTRASSGRVELKFEPDWRKSFFRSQMFQHKSLGENVGKVKDVFTNHFTIVDNPVHNGDGVCFIDEHDNICGFRINKVEGNALYPLEMPKGLRKGTVIYRNQDRVFEQLLSKASAERRISVSMSMDETDCGFRLFMEDEDGFSATLDVECQKELARSHQLDNVKRQLSKLGDTPFVLDDIDIRYKKNWFIPSSMLGEWRRQISSMLLQNRCECRIESVQQSEECDSSLARKVLPTNYLANVANECAVAFYKDKGVEVRQKAFELTHPSHVPVMFCKHCIRRALGMCLKKGGNANEDLYLRLANGTEFLLGFDCDKCEMKVEL